MRALGLAVSSLMIGRAAHAGNEFHVTPTINLHAVLQSGGPGDRFFFADGVYTIDKPLSMVASGTEDEPVILQPEEGAHPIIEMTSGWVIFAISKSSWVTIEGITFQGAEGWDSGHQWFTGLYIDDSTGVTIRDCAVKQVPADGIRSDGNVSQLTIQHTEIGMIGGTGILLGCYDASCATTQSLVSNNWIHDLGDWAIPKTGGRSAIYVYPLSSENEISDNAIHNVSDGIGADVTQGSPANLIEGNALWNLSYPSDPEYTATGIYVTGEATIRNNILYAIDGFGIRTRESGNGALENVVVTHNTVVDTERAGIILSNWAGKPGMVLANNVVANPLSEALSFDGHKDVIDEGNYISSNVVTGGVNGPDEIDVDAMVKTGMIGPGGGYTDFNDVTLMDFFPLESLNSPLIDLGDPASEAWVPAKDFNGLEREGDEPDIGAIEFFYEAQGTNPGWVFTEGFKELTDDVTPGSNPTTGGGCCNNEESSEAGLWLAPLTCLLALRRRRVRAA